MPFLMPMGFIGSPAAVGSSGTASAGTLVAEFLTTDFVSHGGGTGDTAHTFSGLSFGTAAANRLIIAVVLEAKSNSPAGGVATAVTIGGVTATKVVGNATGEAMGSIWQALVPTGTSGAVVVTHAAERNTCTVALWSIKTNTQGSTNSGSSITGASIAAVVPSGGYGVVGYVVDCGSFTSGESITPSNFTEDFDFVPNSAGHNITSGGHITANATIDATSSLSPNDEVLVYASWGP